MRENHISVRKTARYYTLGDPRGDAVAEVWFVCHGYGQIAGRFIRHFAPLDDGRRLIVAPEALNRYYLDPVTVTSASRRVGATWMTREDRLAEIDDYVRYLDDLHAHVLAELGARDVAVHVLGFSQGVATVCRWVTSGAARVDRLTLYAGPIPPEMDLATHAPTFRRMQLSMVLGTRDEMASRAGVEGQEALLRAHDIPFRYVTFDGGHGITSEALDSLTSESR